MKTFILISFLIFSSGDALAICSSNQIPVDTASVTNAGDVLPAKKGKRRVSNKTKRTIGWSLIGAAVLGNVVGLVLADENVIEYEIILFWLIGVCLLIPGVILVILGRRRRK